MIFVRPLQSSEPLIRWNYISDQWDDIQAKLIDHLELTLISVALGLVSLVAIVTLLAARVASRRVPIAPKVVSSWLIAVALLAVTLQLIPVTPGYLPDHLE